MEKLKLAVNISGRGSNLQALIEACAKPNFPAKIVFVISDKKGAAGLTKASNAGIPTYIINQNEFDTRVEFDNHMTNVIESAGVELICLAGFMHLLSNEFCCHWHNRLINIHPSILPSFKGLNAQELALNAGVRFTGCTVHYVRSEMDSGPIIVQAAVPIFDHDNLVTLSKRILIEEHKAYPLAVRLIAEKKVKIENERVIINGHECYFNSIMNPSA